MGVPVSLEGVVRESFTEEVAFKVQLAGCREEREVMDS